MPSQWHLFVAQPRLTVASSASAPLIHSLRLSLQTFIVVGSPGCSHGLGTHNAPSTVLAKLVADYGYGQVQVFNATHALWRWLETPSVEPGQRRLRGVGAAAGLGEPVLQDALWFVDYTHGGLYPGNQ